MKQVALHLIGVSVAALRSNDLAATFIEELNGVSDHRTGRWSDYGVFDWKACGSLGRKRERAIREKVFVLKIKGCILSAADANQLIPLARFIESGTSGVDLNATDSFSKWLQSSD